MNGILIALACLLGIGFSLLILAFVRLQGRLDEGMRQRLDQMERVEEVMRLLEKELREDVDKVRQRVDESLERSGRQLGERFKELVESNERRLGEISGRVEERLEKGFEKTNTVFGDVIKRLAEIDKAQAQISELSGSVGSLNEILADKRSRGAFGEVQLIGLVKNLMPPNSYAEQHTFENGVRADCVLFMPEPTGTLCVDSKFPLESYQRMVDGELGEAERKQAESQFRIDIKKHIKDIAEKYIIPGTTAEGAVMFIPAEAVFAEIHARFPDLVELSQKARVWLASPTTMMAVLTTARAVLKDAATRKQVHIIQDHLVALSGDFGRFQQRMDKLAKHIDLANKDVGEVHTSAKKITNRFTKIEQVELDEPPSGLVDPAD
jgi:DNA recombination protein RmuC